MSVDTKFQNLIYISHRAHFLDLIIMKCLHNCNQYIPGFETLANYVTTFQYKTEVKRSMLASLYNHEGITWSFFAVVYIA